MNKQHICNNCNRFGHFFHQCRLPITSYGLIVFRLNRQNNYEFLMIRRKDSFGLIEFMQGKYQIYDVPKIQRLIDEMSIGEKQSLLTTPFNELLKNLWCNSSKMEETSIKFEMLLNNERGVSLTELVENSTTRWSETEWEFPKGRRNYHEKDLDCAVREFEEETGYNRTCINIIENVIPYEEIFVGSNNKSYKHKYFLASMHNSTCFDTNPKYQTSEVSKTEWKTIDECLCSIRPYSLEKKKIISSVYEVISNLTIQ
jgi:ADP-ribose pyrophosphatase YjhB (NUDIX family)